MSSRRRRPAPDPPEIAAALRFRLLALRFFIVIIPLVCCAVFSGAFSLLLANLYVESLEGPLQGSGLSGSFFAWEFFRPRLPGLAAAGFGLLLFLTALILFLHLRFQAAMGRMFNGPLDSLSAGMEKLRECTGGFRLPPPGGPFRPLYAAFNEAAAALEGESDPRPPLNLLRDRLGAVGEVLDALPEGRNGYLVPAGEKLARLLTFVDEVLLLLALDRAAAGGELFPHSGGPLELGRFLEDLTLELGEGFRERGLALALVEKREGLWIYADAPWLREALVRLLENCVTSKRLEWGRAVIRYRRLEGKTGPESSPEMAEILITDNGPSLGDEALPGLFDRPGFFRPAGGGSGGENGLSLALSARIIRSLGGVIYGEKTPGGGLSVVICFPLEDRPSRASAFTF